MKIAIVGVGYVGLVTGACLAELGHEVTCVDVNRQKIDELNSGNIPIYEPGLEELVRHNTEAQRLQFTTDYCEAIPDSRIVFISVGTPSLPDDGSADLRFVRAAALQISENLNGFCVVVNKSTVPIGTAEEVESIIRSNNDDADFCVASNPEFLREGSAIMDCMNPDRIVIGCADERARAVLQALYAPYESKCPILFTSCRNAEMIKYASNAFLAIKVAFINQIADLCEAVGGDVRDVAYGIGLDKRIGSRFLNAGPGFGGSCFPKDSQALAEIGRRAGKPLSLVEESITSNNARKQTMVNKIVSALGGSVQGKIICVLGVTFKPDTDDVREAPSLVIVPTLSDLGAELHIHDPAGPQIVAAVLPSAHYLGDAYLAAQGADALVFLTEWQEYKAIDFDRLAQGMRGNIVVDLRNIFKPAAVTQSGLKYYCVGK